MMFTKAGPAIPRAAGALVAAALLAGCGAGGSLGAFAAQPGKAVTLPDKRALNLVCSGSGSPTVILESGFGAGAQAWSKVQPRIARTTRVCAYDRAGYGYSDPAPAPRDGAAIARDLDQALTAARLEGPFVLVGHSAGALYARLLAGRRAGETVGLVLVDPTIERRVAAPSSGADGLTGQRRRMRRCLAAAEAGLAPAADEPAWDGCLGRTPDAHTLAIARRPETWRSRLSELDEIFGRTSEQVLRMGRLLQEKPGYVITASETAASAEVPVAGSRVSLWELQHQQLAGSFRHGGQQTVLSSHLVMVERPEVVVSAVLEMVRAARAGVPPRPLPPSETDPPSAQEAEPSPFGSAPDATMWSSPPLPR